MVSPVLLLDTMSLLYRAQAVAPPALAGLTAHVIALRDEHASTRIVFALDDPAHSERRALCPTYKAGRRRTPNTVLRQLRELPACLARLGGEVYRAPGLEADDVLATLARELREAGDPALVVSADRDLIALAHGSVDVLHLGRPQPTRYDADAVRRRFGIPPQRYADWLALKGDRGDGMPGVPDLGPKRAAALIRSWQTIDNLLANLARVKPPSVRAALAAQVGRIRLNARVLTLRDHAELLPIGPG